MKKLISICLLVFFVVIGNAQVNYKMNLNELNQDQLNLALAKSLKSIKTGKTLTFIGAGIIIIGGTIELSSVPGGDDPEEVLNKVLGGSLILTCGVVVAAIGIPIWAIGSNRKHKIEIELVKFNPKGSASINGIGLKIRF
jgi:hypothetical protein